MKKLLIFFIVGFGLAIVVGCGQQHRIETLLKDADDARENEDYDQVIKDCSEAIRLNPKSAAAYLNRGCAFTVTEKFDRAIDDLDETIRLNPENAIAYEMRGYAYLGENRLNEAITNFDISLKIARMFKTVSSFIFNTNLTENQEYTRITID